MNQQMKILKEIAQIADSDSFYGRAEELGEDASKAFGSRHRSQMTSLENIANSTLKVTDVLDYIKKQVARADKNKRWRKDHFGARLKQYIEQDLRKQREEVCKVLEDVEGSSIEGQRIYLHLIREFVRQFVVHYEYQTAIEGECHAIDNRSSPENPTVE